MPNRQYFCWKMCLKFHCGCIQYTSTQHVCNANRGLVCNKWMITRSTDKDCDAHRILGLHRDSSASPSPSPSLDEVPYLQETIEAILQGEGEDQQQQPPAQRRVLSEGSYADSGSFEQGPRRRAAS